MARDYYAEAEVVCQDLERSGRPDLAQGLRDAKARGSTATEILMGLRWKLQQALEEEAGLGSAEVSVRALKKSLDEVLQ
ncbi:hypothetical protein ABI59_14125 [Acidobacteria bacterium Mor1]|nr:hypothetical protein ABI59_14125 [Acidobacteria bacterium Mor1]